jgi:hypothetical protein
MLAADVAYNTIYYFLYVCMYVRMYVCVFVSILTRLEYWHSMPFTLDYHLGDGPNFISMQDVLKNLF